MGEGCLDGPGAYLNPSTSALAHSIRHGSSGRVNHGDEPHKTKVIHGEVDFTGVKLESLGVSVRQVQEAEPWRGTEDGTSSRSTVSLPACPNLLDSSPHK